METTGHPLHSLDSETPGVPTRPEQTGLSEVRESRVGASSARSCVCVRCEKLCCQETRKNARVGGEGQRGIRSGEKMWGSDGWMGSK